MGLDITIRHRAVNHCRPFNPQLSSLRFSPSVCPDEEDEGGQEQEEDLIEVEEEADLIQAERVLDDAIHRDADRDRESQRKKKDEEEVEALAELMLAMAVGKTQPEEEQPPGQSQAGEEWEVIKQRG